MNNVKDRHCAACGFYLPCRCPVSHRLVLRALRHGERLYIVRIERADSTTIARGEADTELDATLAAMSQVMVRRDELYVAGDYLDAHASCIRKTRFA